MVRDEFKDLDAVTESGRRIARETLASAYSWECERTGKTEIVDDGNSAD